MLALALGLGAAAYGLVMGLPNLAAATTRPVAVGLAAAGGAASLVLLGTALAGRRAGFTALLTALVVASSIGYAALPQGVVAGAFGTVRWEPASGEPASAHAVAFGEGDLDLSGITPGTTPAREVSVSVGFGELLVHVPDGITARIELDVSFGEVVQRDRPEGSPSHTIADGIVGSQTVTIGTGATPDVVVHVSLAFGDVRILTPPGVPWATSSGRSTASTGNSTSSRPTTGATASPPATTGAGR